MVNKVKLNEKIVSLRKKKGLSQQDLAEALDVSRQAVSRWEVGTSLPSMENLLALSKLFGTPVDELTSAAELLTLPEHGSEKTGEGKKANRFKGRSKLLGAILAVVVISGMLVVTYLRQDKTEPTEHGIEEFEELDDERISDSNAVISGQLYGEEG